MAFNPTFFPSDHVCDDRGLITSCSSTVNKDLIHNAHPPLSVNLNLVNTTMSSIRRPLPTDDSDVDFQPVTNKKIQRKQRKSKEYHVSQGISIDHASASTELVQNHAIEGRAMHSDGANHQIGSSSQSIPISNESTRYAQTRYSFSPFILRFNSGKISVNQVKECLIDHCKRIHQTNIQIINCRSSRPVGGNNHYDFLVYVKDALSFSFLLEQAHWPSSIGNESFTFPSTPSIPPQLCLLIKNVDLYIDFNEFCDDIKDKGVFSFRRKLN